MQTRQIIAAALLAAAPVTALAQPGPAIPVEPVPGDDVDLPPAADLDADPDAEPAAAAVAEVAVVAPAPAVAEIDAGVEAADRPWYHAIAVNGFASVAYSLNANRPADRQNQVRVFDADDGTVGVDVIEVVVQKAAEAPGQAGFRVDLTAGSAIPKAAASAGLFRDAAGNGQDFDLQQAYVTYVADVGSGLTIDVGKFVTHMGYELIEGYDGFNDQYSRSILFGYAIPFTHTGAKISYGLAEGLTGMLMVANGWDNVLDNNKGKTLGVQLAAERGPAAAYLNYVGGPEQDDNNTNLRHVVDVVATYAASDAVTLGINGDLGYEAEAAAAGAAMWMGAALYATWSPVPRFQLGARGEVFRDRDGVRTDLPQTVFEGTLTPALKLGDKFVLRGDLRFDRSTEEAFMTSSGTSKNQVTVAINALGIL
jgi:hypothetical protein